MITSLLLAFMTCSSDGGSNHATLSHKQLIQIDAMAGIESAAEATALLSNQDLW